MPMLLCDGSDGRECPWSYAGWHGPCLTPFVPDGARGHAILSQVR